MITQMESIVRYGNLIKNRRTKLRPQYIGKCHKCDLYKIYIKPKNNILEFE